MRTRKRGRGEDDDIGENDGIEIKRKREGIW